MAQVPERVLSWLWSVLQTYGQPRLAYNDAAAALTQFPSLKPKTAVYTYENGQTALLLCLFGTLPVDFRGAEYRYPVDLWVPQNYGERGAGVICYVKARPAGCEAAVIMAIRPGQHVAMDGRIYHPYLRDWGVYERSNIVNFLQIARGIFAREPPLVARSSQMSPAPSRADMATPLPPPKVRPGQSSSVELPAGPSGSTPPPLPSKPGQSRKVASPSGNTNTQRADGPPLPPLPPEVQNQQYQMKPGAPHGLPGPPAITSNRYSQAQAPRVGAAPPLPPLPLPQRTQPSTGDRSPISPLSPTHHVELPASRYEQSLPAQQATTTLPTHLRSGSQGHVHAPQQQQQQTYQSGYQQHWSASNGQPQPNSLPAHSAGGQAPLSRPDPRMQTQPTKRAAPAVDLLTDPFDVSLGPATAPGPAPPIPPNPEKEHLLRLVSEAMTSQVRSKVQQAQSAMAPLTAQSHALLEAQSRLQAEIHQLQSLDTILTTNENILHQSIRDCQTVIEGSRKMPEPNIDEVLVAPTVAAQQLWNLCAEEVAIKEAMYCLQRAVGAGRVSSVDFVRLTRSLARECFLKMALARKVSRGLGLEVQGQTGRNY
ncbi:UEV-domain-containing protein [Myriangium duriaei CBS 260.36]|uniref:UEV-domain-containing protein n=1 Tax=Myriangium duriaei CBS 260.36 TaxID=1168546 RepID=A0A9P4J606_9PEZI|nr:UEV-domain-containing protein [Myriangium duriaei CBS 260.36]